MPRQHPERKTASGTPLSTYREKRRAGATPEPIGRPGSERPGLFVVQLHDARRRHYDLRLEIAGVLASWALPHGPSLDPAEKRLAVETEDHPVEYGEFEGVIPAGNYGAGSMIVWDRGLARHLLDPEEGLETGKLLFELHGYKLGGLWTLVRTKRGEGRDWLLIKKPDGAASGEEADTLPPGSVFSGLTVDELAAGADRAEAVREALAEAGAPRGRPLALEQVRPMLATLEREPWSDPDWLFELKYDGFRLLAAAGRRRPGDAAVRLVYRSGRDATAAFPDLVRALAALPYDHLVLDGEVTVLGEGGRPVFQRLQRRALRTRPADVERVALELPAAYFAFDLLGFEDFDLRPLPLERRKEILERLLPAAGPVRYADHVPERGEELFERVREMSLEGLVAKRADSPYRGGRSRAWRKIRAERTDDFAIVGFAPPGSGRYKAGALHLAALDGERWVYVGRVGTGFAGGELARLRRRLGEHPLERPPAEGPLPAKATGGGHVWVEPRLVAEVRYTERTEDGLLRLPVFLRLREDKSPAECPLPPPPLHGDEPGDEPAGGGAAAAEAAAGGSATADDRPAADGSAARAAGADTARRPAPRLRPTRRDKVFWPEEGYTKGDLLDYYQAVAPVLLPYLADRPVVLDRYPDGIAGKSFFQKNAPDHVPDWVRTEPTWSEDGGTFRRTFVADEAETLLYLANLGSIPLHVWSSRVERLQHPDWAILDLDAKDAAFADVVAVARWLAELCAEIELPVVPKTSGATGLHLLIPLAPLDADAGASAPAPGGVTHEQARQLAEILARLAAEALPDRASVARLPGARAGKVYVDFLQNGYGKLLVAPYSVRPRPGAPVSTPLDWSEVGPDLDPTRFTIRTVPHRVEEQGDLLRPLRETRADLPTALARLAERL